MNNKEKSTALKVEKLSKTLDIKINKNKQNPAFKTKEVVFLLIITAIIGLTMGGIITYNINLKNQKTDSNIQEFIDNYNYIANNYYGKIDKSKLVESAISGMLSSLDKNSMYVGNTNSNFSIYLEGKYKGTGIQVYNNDDNNIVIYSILPNTPAAKANLKTGDVITKINNKDVTNTSMSEFSKIVKEQKNKILLTYKRDEKQFKTTLKVENIELKSVASKIIEKENKKIGYIRITIFANNTYSQLKKHLNKLEKQNIDGLIIDLRDNSGGHLTAAEDILSEFLDKAHPIYQIKSKNNKTKYYSHGKETKKYKIALLVNENSASASEIVSSALKEQYGASIIGKKTYGKGTVQELQTLPNGEQYKLTTKSWLTSKGETIDKNGINPDYEVTLNEEYSKNPSDKNDNQLQKALEIILKWYESILYFYKKNSYNIKKGEKNMEKLKKGQRLQIQCYKHNGKIHRCWDEAVLLDKKEDYMVFGNEKTLVTEAEGSTWRTKEPAIMYFFKNRWYNIIVQLKKDGITYYCNIATPFIIEDNTIKYIDYDLDLRIFPNGSFKILDRGEYKYHKKIMNYPDNLDIAIRSALSELITDYRKKDPAFNKKLNLAYNEEYKKIKGQALK